MTLIASTLQAFFTERLSQRHASPRTIAAYRDTLKLLLIFVHRRSGKPPIRLDWDDLDHDRGVSQPPRVRPAQQRPDPQRALTAIRSLFSFAALRHSEHAQLIQRVLAIPPKRSDNRIVSSLPPPTLGMVAVSA